MIIGFYTGWIFLICAFASAAAESLVFSLPHDNSWWVSAYDLWFAIRPGLLVVTQIQVEKISPFLWDPVITTLLIPPAWASFTGLGIALGWGCWPGRHMTEYQREDLQKLEESMFLYDELAREALENGYVDDEDDQRPSLSDHISMEYISEQDPPTDDQLMAEINDMHTKE